MKDVLYDTLTPQALGLNIREARKESGLTQRQLAGRLGMARSTFGAIERGERRHEPRELIEIAACLDCHMFELFQWTELKDFRLREPLVSTEPGSLPRGVVLAIEAWQRAELSEGQLVRLWRMDRVDVREVILRFEAAQFEESDDSSIV